MPNKLIIFICYFQQMFAINSALLCTLVPNLTELPFVRISQAKEARERGREKSFSVMAKLAKRVFQTFTELCKVHQALQCWQQSAEELSETGCDLGCAAKDSLSPFLCKLLSCILCYSLSSIADVVCLE